MFNCSEDIAIRGRAPVAYTPYMSETTHTDHNQSDNADLAADLREAVETILPGALHPVPVTDAPHLLRVSTPDGDRVIRRWEADATADRIEFTAKALERAAAAGIDVIPRFMPIPERDGRHALLLRGRFYTAATWLEGRPFARYGGYRTPAGETIDIPMPPATPSNEVALAAVTALGRFHVATAGLAESQGSGIPHLSMRDFLMATQRAWATNRRILGDRAAGNTEIRRWLRCGNRVMAAGSTRLEAASSVLADTGTVVHHDLWPTHLLVSADTTSPELTGIAGWSQVTTSSPLLDLANLAVHVHGWSAEAAENLIGAYHDVAPLSPEERRTLPVIAALDLVTRVARLLHLAYVDERMIGHESTPVLRGAIRTLLTSLETLTHVLAPPEPKRYQPARTGGGSRGETGGSRAPVRRPGSSPARPARTGSADQSRRLRRQGRPKER